MIVHSLSRFMDISIHFLFFHFLFSLSLFIPSAVAPFALKSAPSLLPRLISLFKRWSCIPYLDIYGCFDSFSFPFFFLNCVCRLSSSSTIVWIVSFQYDLFLSFFFLWESATLIILLITSFAIIFWKISLVRLKYFTIICLKKKKMETQMVNDW